MNYIYECAREASNLNSAEDGARKDLPRRLREISTQSLENINCIFFSHSLLIFQLTSKDLSRLRNLRYTIYERLKLLLLLSALHDVSQGAERSTQERDSSSNIFLIIQLLELPR